MNMERLPSTMAAPDAGSLIPLRDVEVAFTPVVDTQDGCVVAYEAQLRRGATQTTRALLAGVPLAERAGQDHNCRTLAMAAAVKAGIATRKVQLGVSILAALVHDPAAEAEETIFAAIAARFPHRRLVLQFSEGDGLDGAHMAALIAQYHRRGFMVAFDDFGSADNGLDLLARFTPDAVKIDAAIVHRLCSSWSRRLVVESIVQIAERSGIRVVAKGVATRGEYDKLLRLGVRYMQGPLFGAAEVGRLPLPDWEPFEPGLAG